MGYFKFGPYKVPSYQKNVRELEEAIVKSLNLTAEESILRLIAGNEIGKRIVKLLHKELQKSYQEIDGANFIKKWVEFRFEKEKASSLAWDILYDYLHASGKGWLQDLRDFPEKLTDDYMGDNFIYPQGKIVKLHLNTHSKRSFLSKFKSDDSISFLINLENVVSISGTLDSLIYSTTSEEFRFSSHIEYINKGQSKRSST